MESEMKDNNSNQAGANASFPLLSTKEGGGTSVVSDVQTDSDFNEILKSSRKKKKVRPFTFQENILSIETSEDSCVLNDLSDVSSEPIKADDLDLTFNFSQKKKKSLRKAHEDLVAKIPAHSEEIKALNEKAPVLSEAPVDSDYTYEYLLSRFYIVAAVNLPRADQDLHMKIVLKPPQVVRVGSKKTLFANFSDICRSIHRPPQHFISYIFAELGTCGSVDGENHLLIRGRFQQNQVSNIIRRYVMEYVKCATCNSFDTFIQKRIRLNFLICENCNSQRSVASIKSGFQAITAKRSAIRAKTLI